MALHVEREGDKLYFIAADGARWRVSDVGFGPAARAAVYAPRLRPRFHTSDRARFIAPDGSQRV